MSYDDLEWLMGINFWGVVHGTKAFLPHLKAAGEGHVVNLSSVFGLLSIPTQSAYNAAKFGVRGFTDALRIELDAADCGVSSTTVHPGGIRTNIVRNARLGPGVGGLPDDRDEAVRDFDRIARTTPEKAARQILLAVQRNRRRALIGPDAKVLDLVSRLPAGLYQRVLAQGVQAAADHVPRLVPPPTPWSARWMVGAGGLRGQAVEEVAGDLLDLGVAAGQAVGPVGRSRGDDRAAAAGDVAAEHGVAVGDALGRGRVAGVEQARRDELELGRLVRLRAAGSRSSRVKWAAGAVPRISKSVGVPSDPGGHGQAVAVGEVAAVALVADERRRRPRAGRRSRGRCRRTASARAGGSCSRRRRSTRPCRCGGSRRG